MPVLIGGIIWFAVSVVLTPVIGWMLHALLRDPGERGIAPRKEPDADTSDWRPASQRGPAPQGASRLSEHVAAYSEPPPELSRGR
jgi:hypothetical protein